MKNFVLGFSILAFFMPIFSYGKCVNEIKGYRIVKDTVFPFKVDKEPACFFAFYTQNPEPMAGSRGNGNLGDSLWYGYYKLKNPSEIKEFPKPSNNDWSMVCSIEAISFYPMHNNKKRDVTIIGSCDKQNAINYTYPFVFTWHNDKFVLDEQVSDLAGFINLTISDIQKYIKYPDSYYKILSHRYDINR